MNALSYQYYLAIIQIFMQHNPYHVAFSYMPESLLLLALLLLVIRDGCVAAPHMHKDTDAMGGDGPQPVLQGNKGKKI